MDSIGPILIGPIRSIGPIRPIGPISHRSYRSYSTYTDKPSPSEFQTFQRPT